MFCEVKLQFLSKSGGFKEEGPSEGNVKWLKYSTFSFLVSMLVVGDGDVNQCPFFKTTPLNIYPRSTTVLKEILSMENKVYFLI